MIPLPSLPLMWLLLIGLVLLYVMRSTDGADDKSELVLPLHREMLGGIRVKAGEPGS